MTQHEKIVTIMLRNQYKDWWLPYDFMRDVNSYLFVGYEASARLTELRKLYPEMLSSRREGKYIATRLNKSTVRVWFNILPKNLKMIVAKELDYYPHIPENRWSLT